MQELPIDDFIIGEGHPLVLISGPCVIESEDLAMRSAEILKEICTKLNIPLIYKSSYDKANRSSISSFRGPGIEKGLQTLEKVKKEFSLPIITDVHSPEEATQAGACCDMIQIPAFLCRQTDLLIAAGKSNAAVNVKKGQFLAPWDMKNVIEKLVSTGNKKILLTDRGTSFGYNNLVTDLRAIPIMQKFGFPVCFDASHSVQLPGGHGSSSGGQREFIPTLAKGAVAAGANALFLETHPDPKTAKSDRDSVFPLGELPSLLKTLLAIYSAIRER